jgi:RNA polymerase sigma factor (sigma-70 family)
MEFGVTKGLPPMLPSVGRKTLQSVTSLLDQINAGDGRQLGPLYALVRTRLTIMATKLLESYPIVKEAEGVDDIVQELWQRLSRALLHCKPSDSRKFFGLAGFKMHQLLTDMVRRLRRTRHSAVEDFDAYETKIRMFKARRLGARTTSRGPATTCERHEQICRLLQAVGRLSGDEREVLMNTYYLGLSAPAAAKVMGLSEKTVDRRLDSARKHLLVILEKMGPVGFLIQQGRDGE